MRRPIWIRSLPMAGLALLVLTSCGKERHGPAAGGLLAGGRPGPHPDHAPPPAIAGAVVRGDSIAAIAALGVRKLGAPDSVTLTDHFHLGSNVKAMTADLLGMEVEAGHLAWDRTLAQVFPEFADSMHAEYRGVTLEALLQHRAGLPAFTDATELATVPDFTGALEERRQAAARWLLRQAPAIAPGRYLYSNAGYALAGAILERSAGASWESLIQGRLWVPLGLAGASAGRRRSLRPALGHWTRAAARSCRTTPTRPSGSSRTCSAPRATRTCPSATTRSSRSCTCARCAAILSCSRRPRSSALHAASGSYAMGWGVQPIGGVTTWFHAGSAGTFERS